MQAQQQQSPQMLDMMKRLGMAAQKVLYSTSEGARGIVNMVGQGADPAQGLAKATFMVLQQLRSQVKGLDPNAVFLIAPIVLAMIAEMAAKAKVIPEDPKLLSAALEVLKQELGVGEAAKAAPAEESDPEAEEEAPEDGGGLIGQAMEA